MDVRYKNALRQQVKEVLLTPIVCQKTVKGIYRSDFPQYAKEFSPENFGALHFLDGIFINGTAVIDFSSAKDPSATWEEILWEKVEKRAELIACKKGPELYEFFSGLGITDTRPAACRPAP